MPPEEKKEINQVGVGGIKSLRTYEGDVAEALGKNKVTVAQIAIAENVKKTGSETVSTKVEKKTGSNVLLTLFSLLFIAGGIIGGLFFFSKSTLWWLRPAIQVKSGYRGILSSNSQKQIFLGTLIDKRLEEVISYEKTSSKIPTGQVEELYFTKGDKENPVLISPEEFMNLSTSNAPESIRRSLTNVFMFGFYNNSGVTEPFLVLKTNFFQNTFTGMLKWEPYISKDLEKWGVEAAQGTFEDKVIKNKDTRILKDAGGVRIMYGFLDKETLVLTTSEASFLDILDRFEKQTYIR